MTTQRGSVALFSVAAGMLLAAVVAAVVAVAVDVAVTKSRAQAGADAAALAAAGAAPLAGGGGSPHDAARRAAAANDTELTACCGVAGWPPRIRVAVRARPNLTVVRAVRPAITAEATATLRPEG